MALTKLADLGYRDDGPRSHTVDHHSIKLERAEFPLKGWSDNGSESA
jgi:hypothetical protein